MFSKGKMTPQKAVCKVMTSKCRLDMKMERLFWTLMIIGAFLLTSCAVERTGDLPEVLNTPSSTTLAATPGSPQTPRGWHQVLPFDGIRPIYDPQFTSAEEAALKDKELVMGVAWEGEAKAYPVTVLRSREMVNDEMAGEPYLVSW